MREMTMVSLTKGDKRCFLAVEHGRWRHRVIFESDTTNHEPVLLLRGNRYDALRGFNDTLKRLTDFGWSVVQPTPRAHEG